MGLDVYLYRYDNFVETRAREEQHSKQSEAIYDRVFNGRKYEEVPEPERETARQESKAAANALGLDDYGSAVPPARVKIEENSAKYPNHMFKIGYFRSSYNEGGIDRILRAHCGTELGDIFAVENDGYYVTPDWLAARGRAQSALSLLKESPKERALFFGAVSVFGRKPDVAEVKTEADALRIYHDEVRRQTESESYSNASGTFFRKEPLQVRALIQATGPFSEPGLYAVFDWTGSDWYLQALEIVIETCEYVLSQPKDERPKFVLHWSG